MSVELARRAVACRHWRWLPGMRAVRCPDKPALCHIRHSEDDYRETNVRITAVLGRGLWWGVGDDDLDCDGYHAEASGDAHIGALPDLSDAATLGCLLQLVRQARQEPWYYPTAQVYGGQVLWLVERPVRERQTLHESEASALVAALEAVP
jgi:hypothetical protein